MTLYGPDGQIPIIRPLSEGERILRQQILESGEESAHNDQPFVVMEIYTTNEGQTMLAVGTFPSIEAATGYAEWVSTKPYAPAAMIPLQLVIDPRRPCKTCGNDATFQGHEQTESGYRSHRWEPRRRDEMMTAILQAARNVVEADQTSRDVADVLGAVAVLEETLEALE